MGTAQLRTAPRRRLGPLAVPASVTAGVVTAGAVVSMLLAGPLAGLAGSGDAGPARPRPTPSVAGGPGPEGRLDPAKRVILARMQVEACLSTNLRAQQAGLPTDPHACPPWPGIAPPQGPARDAPR